MRSKIKNSELLLPLSMANDPSRCGYKAYNLQLVANAGIRVPKGMVLTVDAFVMFLNYYGLSAKAFDEQQRIFIQDAIYNKPFPKPIENALNQLFKEFKDAEFDVIVRSSATSEDSSQTSFAGQFASIFSHATKTGIGNAIRSVWASTFTSHAVLYEEESHGKFETRMAVLVQPIVRALSSGVYFSKSPQHPECLRIEATWGLPDTLVKGLIQPDVLEIKDEQIISSENGDIDLCIIPLNRKDKKNLLPNDYTPNPFDDASTESWKIVWIELESPLIYLQVPETYKKQYSITHKTAKDLLQIANSLEKMFSCNLDIEWTSDKDGVCIVQVRPDTFVHQTFKGNSLSLPDIKDASLLRQVTGKPASPGQAMGRAKVVKNIQDISSFSSGDILVCGAAKPEFMPAVMKSSGIISADSGMLCHIAIIARELGKPCVVGVYSAAEIIKDGEQVLIDGTTGSVEILNNKQNELIQKTKQGSSIDTVFKITINNSEGVEVARLSVAHSIDWLLQLINEFPSDEDGWLLLATFDLYSELNNSRLIERFLSKLINRPFGILFPNEQIASMPRTKLEFSPEKVLVQHHLDIIYQYFDSSKLAESHFDDGSVIMWLCAPPKDELVSLNIKN